MSPNMVHLLTRLSENLELQKRYVENPKAVMKEYGLTAAEQKMILDGDEKAVMKQASAGASGIVICKVWQTAPPKPKK